MLDMPPQLARPSGLNGGHPIPTRRRKRAKLPADRAPALVGWLSNDADEIARRRWRGRTEIGQIEPLERDPPYFGSFRVRSAGGSLYDVEIRSLDQPLNSCGCADHRVNGLGTCKHIEGVLTRLRQRGVRAFTAAQRQGSPRVELFLPRTGDPVPRLVWPTDPAVVGAAHEMLAPFLGADGSLADPSADRIAPLLQAVANADPLVQQQLRVSRYLEPWLAEARRRAARVEARARFLAEVAAGAQTIDVLKHPLLPYQCDGMLHLAFGERALLADDMGLGKTIQAIAAVEVLRRLHGIARVLVVCPASLKGEWQEQIARFSGAATLLVTGSRPARLAQYAHPGFFTVVNYEQVVIDAADINRTLRPDIVILDEAQRIKNWHTKTARAVKSLASHYTFVLTGTPIENRIDEIYSIVQYLDPGLLGPLFRFNRDFYDLDERGRPIGYKNLDELMRRLQSVMLRRRKRDVETELPGRTVKNFLVGMADEQRLRYDEYKAQAARLVHIAQRRPLTQQEFERLQRLLACMRMLCDTPFILDPACRVSPKLEELERVLTDLLAEPERKVIVFSEWERMLTLVRELAEDMGIEVAWHTGSVPQDRRRAEIARFKRDPECRLFLSTDSGSVGLNLQTASAVINLDLPWNPAKLEQRIARAWRKNQMRTVDVINLVTEDSIEHAMLHVLSQKQALADGVLDGDGDLKAMALPSGRRAFVERMAAMMAPPAAPEPEPLAERSLRDELIEQHGDGLLLLESRHSADGSEVLLAVLEDADTAAAEQQRLAAADGPRIEVLDRRSYETVQRLTNAGALSAPPNASQELHRSPNLAPAAADQDRQRLAKGAEFLGNAERKLRMALLLAEGGFAAEAMPALDQCLELAANARRLMTGDEPVEDADIAEPPAASALPIDEVAGSIARLLADIGRTLRPAVAVV
ncbi:MAG TPA: DEAD/DEAH box helicase [Acetobacteraceae bacterium]|nr:DEAD/DEAH box helicase [Acetobacteraceae bacterium]